MTVALFSCGLEDLERQVNKSVDDLTDAERHISVDASNATDVLRGIKNDYPREIKDIINNDVDRLIKTSISTTSEEARCDLDFVSKRLKFGLENTIVKLKNLVRSRKNQEPLPLLYFKPSFCTITPEQIDLNEDNKKPLKIYGYDFDDISKISVTALTFDGKTKDITRYLTRPTDYMLTLKTDDPSIFTNFNITKFSYRDSNLYSVLIVPKSPQICKEEDRAVTPIPDKINFFAHRVGDGDGDYAGDVRVGCSAVLKISQDGRSIICTIGFYADEVNGDTHGRYDGDHTVYTAPAGEKIRSINTPTSYSVAYVQKGNDPVEVAGNGCVVRAIVRADHKGDDVPGYTGAEIDLNTINVTLIEDDKDGACVEKSAYTLAHPLMGQDSSKNLLATPFKVISPQEFSIIQSIDKLKLKKEY